MSDSNRVPEVIDQGITVGLLESEWRVLGDLLGSLDTAEWECPALPGWNVHDVVSHIIGTERTFLGDAPPEVPEPNPAPPHVLNAIAALNEAWVVTLHERSHAELLDDFRTVTDERLGILRNLSAVEFAAPSWTPVGQATYGRFLQIRVFDSYMHEQDIRVATQRPGHLDGPEAGRSLDESIGALGYIVGKRGRAPEGSSVTFELTAPLPRTVHVLVDGRAAVVGRLPSNPTCTITLASDLFLRLAGGRTSFDATMDQIHLGGDRELAERVASNLAFTI